MTVKLNQDEIDYIANAFKANCTVEEISVETGVGKQNVKRALCEAGLMKLDWYKSSEEIAILNYLKAMGIVNLKQLREMM